MKITVYSADGTAFEPGVPVSILIERAMDVPADRLEVVFPISAPLPELDKISVSENGIDEFYGLVDEQVYEITQRGGMLYISARSLAAALLDNEAMVQTYETPTLMEIYKRHAKPHGILGVRGAALAYNGIMTIGKGKSDWSVIADYCRGVGGVRPHITPDRYLDVRKTVDGIAIKYSNFDADGIRCSSIAYTIRRCSPISEILLKSTNGGTYQITEQNHVINGKGIHRRRLMELNSSLGSIKQYAWEQIRDSNYEYEQYQLRTLGRHLPELGRRAQLQDNRFGTVNGLAVAEVSYHQNADGEYSDIILVPESIL